MTNTAGTKRVYGDAGDDFFSIATDASGSGFFMGPGDDIMYLSDRGRSVSGGGGNDLVETGGLFSGPITGGRGDDEIRAYGYPVGASNRIDCGPGQDLVHADPGDDVASNCETTYREISGGSGDDHLVGTSSDDDMAAYAGDDVVEGLAGDDVLYLGTGSDVAHGGAGDDIVWRWRIP